MRYFVLLTLTLAACFGVQTLALHSVGGKTNKSESNFFSSVARIQSGILGNPEIMLLGSSMTGRLPDRNQGFAGVTNLGCDGASAAETLRAMDQGKLPVAPVLIIEGNTLYRASSGTPSEIARAIDSPWFQVGGRIPNLSATARPTAFFYSRLLARKIGQGGKDSALPIQPTRFPEKLSGPLPPLNESESRLIDELTAVIKRLEKRGSQILITVLPPGNSADSPHVRLPAALAIRTGLPFWNLAASFPSGQIHFTDGVHMDPSSAAAVMNTLLESIRHP
jgi:hypothetical protein